MFASFRGQIINISNEKLILEVSGVGYLISCSIRSLKTLEVGQTVFLLAETIVREDHIGIYGFIDNLEQQWFNLLITVKGIGPKMALQILGQIDVNFLSQEIANQNKSIFKGINGIGSKIAERIMLELKDKILPQDEFGTNTPKSSAHNEQYEDAIMALSTLGYQRSEAYRVVNSIFQVNNALQTREIIKLALKDLSK